jgi:hypothetical protein
LVYTPACVKACETRPGLSAVGGFP